MSTDGDGGALRTVGSGRFGSKSPFRRFRQQGIQAVIQVAQLGEDRVRFTRAAGNTAVGGRLRVVRGGRWRAGTHSGRFDGGRWAV
jgi:hypothetical protein